MVEEGLLLLAGNSEEEKNIIRHDRRTEMLRQYLMRPIRENADQREAEEYRLMRTGVKYRLVPASSTRYPGPTWEYVPACGMQPIEETLMEEVFTNPHFGELANGADILFFVAHDENGKALAAEHVEWGSNFNFGWSGIQSHNAMLNTLSK
ncbi:MAG: hypothetical protein M1383_02490 [Patescibacteria group bacterium]|nr:hypothetical protein [Patescibacteria group bacterium]